MNTTFFRSCGFLIFAYSIAIQAQQSAQQQPNISPATPVLSSCGMPSTGHPTLDQYRCSHLAIFSDDFGQLKRYRGANGALHAMPLPPDRVVFFGDSITDIWKLEKYFGEKPYENRGIGGQTTPQMLVRFRQDVIDLHPKVVLILAGTNDLAGNSGPMLTEDIEANLSSMAELAKVHDIRVILASVLPVHNYTPQGVEFSSQRPAERILELNTWLKSYCAKNNLVYLDYFSAMVDDKGMLKKDLADDGLHPNDAGFKVMAPLAEAAIAKAMK
jgi:lysophospholipase L1-like esterase